MDQLICHLIGDYVLQTDWMARKKLEKLHAAVIHAFVYAIPFTLITGFSRALLVIFITHVIIDRYRVAAFIMKLKHWSWKHRNDGNSTPPEIRTMLIIVIDNTMHLAINYLAIKYFG